MERVWQALALLLATALVGGCALSITTAPVLPSPPPPTPLPAEEPAPAPGWETLAPGLERRQVAPLDGNALVQLVAARVDPARYRFRVHYRPGEPLGLNGWMAELPGAALITNGGFFDPQQRALGLVVADGVVSGNPFADRGGTFLVRGGFPAVTPTGTDSLEGLEQALQAFPMLVRDGAASYTNRADTDVSRRTVVAQDSAGRVVILITPLAGLTLADLSAFLAASDLGLVHALNLDGGGSTMLYLGGATPTTFRSFDPVPAVLAVYPR